MSELVMIRNNQVVVSSRQVAEAFKKRHSDTLRAVRRVINSAQNCVQWFRERSYKDDSGKKCCEYLITKDGFMLLVMGFSGEKAMQIKVAYINAFNEMEKQLKEKQQAAKIAPVQQSLPLNAPEYVRPYECVEYMQRMEEVKGITKAAQVMIDEMECGRKKGELEAAWKVIGDILWKAGYYANSIARVKMPTYPTLE